MTSEQVSDLIEKGRQKIGKINLDIELADVVSELGMKLN